MKSEVMETKIKYIDHLKCPSAKHYQIYLNGEGSQSFFENFEKHLKNCELCSEAIAGYKMNILFNSNYQLPDRFSSKKVFHLKNLIPYAAAVVILIALVFISPLKIKLFNSNYLAHETNVLESNYNKKLMHKSSAEYWCINQNDKVTLNDQLVAAKDLENSIVPDNKNDMVMVQIESTSTKATEEVLSKIKKNKAVPVYTYSKHKGLKKN